MKRLLSLLICSLVLISCNDSKKAPGQKRMPESGGKVNTLTIVTNNALWNGEIGDVVRSIFTEEVIGLPQQEPTFDLKQMNYEAFHQYVQKSRTFIEIKKGEKKGIRFIKDLHARPQLGILIYGQNNDEIKDLLNANKAKMIAKVKEMEYENQKMLINLLPYERDDIKKTFNIDLDLRSDYRVGKHTDNFIWLRKDIKNGSKDLLIYELPYNYIKNDSLAVSNIVKLRDSIGQTHIPGEAKESFMITERAYAPYFFNTTLDGKPTLETRGVWDVFNDTMSGPFINFIINDKANNRQLVFEGFVYCPLVEKRDHIFELETIIKSVKIN